MPSIWDAPAAPAGRSQGIRLNRFAPRRPPPELRGICIEFAMRIILSLGLICSIKAGFLKCGIRGPLPRRGWSLLLWSSEDMERRLAAIVCADVAGYSRMMGNDEAG